MVRLSKIKVEKGKKMKFLLRDVGDRGCPATEPWIRFLTSCGGLARQAPFLHFLTFPRVR